MTRNRRREAKRRERKRRGLSLIELLVGSNYRYFIVGVEMVSPTRDINYIVAARNNGNIHTKLLPDSSLKESFPNVW